MALSKKNKAIIIDKEAEATLALVQEKILGNVDKLMSLQESKKVSETGYYKGSPMPIPFFLAPNGDKNRAVIESCKQGEILDLATPDKKKIGELEVEDSFLIDKIKRVENIYGAYDTSNEDASAFFDRLGDMGISGYFKVDSSGVKKEKEKIRSLKEKIGATSIAAIMMGAKPFHRAHERLIRITLDRSDMLVIFLMKPFKTDGLSYELRYKTLEFFIENYLPRNRVLIVPFENTYMFHGTNNLILQNIVASNFGCNKLVVGQNHAGIGLYYDHNQIHSSLDRYKDDLPLEMIVMAEFVYCNECKTLVSTKTCPHGSHHHIKYHGKSLQKLIKAGILPPALFMRREISSFLLSRLFPNRFSNIQQIYDDLFPNEGLLESKSNEDFYLELMKLYQTMSLV